MRASVTHVNTGVVNDSTIGVGFAGAADAYALDGTKRYHLFGRQTMLVVQVGRRRAFAVRLLGPGLQQPWIGFDVATGRQRIQLPPRNYNLTLLN